MKMLGLFCTWVISFSLFFGCSDDTNEPSASDANADSTDTTDVSPDVDQSASRFTVTPATLHGFGHETVTVSDGECDWADEPAVSVQGIEAVLVAVSEDGCNLSFDVQGGSGGAAPIEVTVDGDGLVTVDGFEYLPTVGGDMFERSICIGDSLGSAMVSWYLSYDAQVRDGMFAFFFRQASAYCPHPLVRAEGVPRIITLADLDADEGIIPQTTLLTTEMVQYFTGQRPLSELRLNPDMVHCNQSVPGFHDVTWIERPVVFEPSVITSLYEKLFRFPNGVPDDPAPILDTVHAVDPTFIIVSPGVMAYALDGNWVTDETLDEDLDHFLTTLAELPSEPVVLLASLPDTASIPFHTFSYSERYFALRVNNRVYEAVDRANQDLGEERFVVSPLAEIYYEWFTGPDEVTFGGTIYPGFVDGDGWPHIRIEDSAGVEQEIGLGRFQGFFSLDDVHLTPTGHALTANEFIDTLNRAFGPDSDTPRLSEDVPFVDIPAVLVRDHESKSRLATEADALGLPELSTFQPPVPPELSRSELCAITAGPMASASDTGCPASIDVLVDGVPCGDDPVTLPAELTITVTDGDGTALEDATVGLAVIPAEEHDIMAYLDGGVTAADGSVVLTVTADDVTSALAGGAILVESGTASVLCRVP